jgi:D-3-phosphoglycerate dehydrogenase
VSVEVVEAVVDALQGKLSATAVNAPLVDPETLKELAPFVTLAEGLGKVSSRAGQGGGGLHTKVSEQGGLAREGRQGSG